jgi:hypothetical protein
MRSIVTRLISASGYLLPAFRSSSGIRGPSLTNFGKPRPTENFDSSAAYDFEVPKDRCGEIKKNFKIGGAGTTRLRRPRYARSSGAQPRPSHPAPNVRDDREAPVSKGARQESGYRCFYPSAEIISENPKSTRQ